MGHQLDFIERIRRALARPLGALITGVKRRKTGANQFVGYIEMEEEAFEAELHDMGFERNPLSYWKYIPGVGGETGSWRRTYGPWQLHVILFDGSREDAPPHDGHSHDDRTYVYAHWEYRWDWHPIKHLRGTHSSAEFGVWKTRDVLDAHDIEHYTES